VIVREGPPVVLVVDDDPRSLKLMTIVLGAAGYSVVTANDAPAGLRSLAVEPPDVVLVDFLMPGMNGLEFCRKVREARGPGAPPLVLFTAMASGEIRAQAQRAGVDHIMVKPFDRSELLDRLAELLGRSGSSPAPRSDAPAMLPE
jgi:DNA-binding response OmpR family regulator